MKKVKKLISIAVVMVIVFSLATAAFAEEAVFDSTNAFLKKLKEIDGARCEIIGVKEAGESGKMEIIEIRYDGPLTDYPVNTIAGFSEENDAIYFLVYNFSKYEPEMLFDAIGNVNAMNAAFKWIKFYVDPTDSTITASMDLIVNKDCAGELGSAGFVQLMKTINDAIKVMASLTE